MPPHCGMMPAMPSDARPLPPDTARVWAWLEGHPLMTGFMLIGGAAAALQLGHRSTEDLDFAWVGPSDALPRTQLQELQRLMAAQGWPWRDAQRPENVQRALKAGMQLADYQQVHRVGESVQLTLVSLDPPLRALLQTPAQRQRRIASLDDLLLTKLYAASRRSRCSDWVDLHALMTQHGYHLGHAVALFRHLDRPDLFQSLLARLRECRAERGPQPPEKVRHHLRALVEELDRRVESAGPVASGPAAPAAPPALRPARTR